MRYKNDKMILRLKYRYCDNGIAFKITYNYGILIIKINVITNPKGLPGTE